MIEPRHRVVVALDLSEYAEIVLEHALDQAARHSRPELHFLYVAEDATADVEDAKERLAELVILALEDLDCAEWRVRMHVRHGRTAEEIANLADEVRAQLIILGRFGSHRPHRRIGATASRVIDLAPCATLVVGLANEDDAAARAQCPGCVEVRETSDGWRWFCDAHAGDHSRLSAMVTPDAGWMGGLMW